MIQAEYVVINQLTLKVVAGESVVRGIKLVLSEAFYF